MANINVNAVRDAFSKIKEEISMIFSCLFEMKKEIEAIKNEISEIKRTFSVPTHFQHISNTFPTHHYDKWNENEKFLRNKAYFQSSTGNEGVPTHFQHISNTSTSLLRQINANFSQQNLQIDQPKAQSEKQPQDAKLQQAHDQNLNEIAKFESYATTYKQEIVKRFKSLTKKEFDIFSLIYSMQKVDEPITYKTLAQKTGLAPSSVRDLVNRLILKGIPVEKSIIFKEVFLKIPDEFFKIASIEALEKIVQLSQKPLFEK
jgi:hypothetical protein